jgi:glycosyltransferase involved in cell wall biosynthesis
MGAGLCVLTSDVPENREVVDGAGFTFTRGDSADLAERLHFLIANPSVREAAGRTAKKRIANHFQWEQISEEIERAYFNLLGPNAADASIKKPSVRIAADHKNPENENVPEERRAG